MKRGVDDDFVEIKLKIRKRIINGNARSYPYVEDGHIFYLVLYYTRTYDVLAYGEDLSLLRQLADEGVFNDEVDIQLSFLGLENSFSSGERYTLDDVEGCYDKCLFYDKKGVIQIDYVDEFKSMTGFVVKLPIKEKH